MKYESEVLSVKIANTVLYYHAFVRQIVQTKNCVYN